MPAKTRSRKIETKYEQVCRILREDVSQQRCGVGDVLPSESRLMRELGVSRVTIRRAMAQLAKDGLIQAKPGIGHVVRARRASPLVGILFGNQIYGPQEIPSYRMVIDALRQRLTEHQFTTQFYCVRSYDSQLRSDREQLIDDLRKDLLMGLITVAWPCPDKEDARLAAEDRELMTLINEKRLAYTGWCTLTLGLPGAVALDTENVGRLGAAHFLDKGLNAVALITGANAITDQTSVVTGYRQALDQAGVEMNPAWVVRVTELSRDAGYAAMQRLWALDDKPQAVVVTDDNVIQGAMTAVLELGIDVPRSLQLAVLFPKGSNIFFPKPFVRLQIDLCAVAEQITGQLLQIMHEPDQIPAPLFHQPQVIDGPGNAPSSQCEFANLVV